MTAENEDVDVGTSTYIWRGTVAVRNLETGRVLQEFKHDRKAESVALSADWKTLVTVETDYDNDTSVVTARRVDTGAQLQKFEYDYRDFCLVSGDGKGLVIVETDDAEDTSVVTVRNVDTGAQLQKFSFDHQLTDYCASGDGKTLCVMEGERRVIVRHVDAGAEAQRLEQRRLFHPSQE